VELPAPLRRRLDFISTLVRHSTSCSPTTGGCSPAASPDPIRRWCSATASAEQQGICHLLTKPAHPTTTGKIERFHRTLRVKLLDNPGFTSLEAAQQEINAYVVHSNTERPHQALGGATLAELFTYETARG
jgi:transposase InsO family protein